MKQKRGALDYILYPLLAIAGVCTLYPFWNITVIVFNDALDAMWGGLYLWPRQVTMDNFRTIFAMPQLSQAFVNSVLRTVCGSVLSVVSISMVAYVISRREFMFRGLVSRLFVVTMYVNGGLMPYQGFSDTRNRAAASFPPSQPSAVCRPALSKGGGIIPAYTGCFLSHRRSNKTHAPEARITAISAKANGVPAMG